MINKNNQGPTEISSDRKLLWQRYGSCNHNSHVKLDNNNDVSTKNYVVIPRKIIMSQQEKVIMELWNYYDNYLVKWETTTS